jgi:hypothetical protein
MRPIGLMLAVAACGLTAPLAGVFQEGNRMHTETTFDVMVNAPLAETAVLFSPEGERAWAGKHWDPQFLYPLPARDQQGAVFTINHGPVKAVWVVAQRNLEARHFQYVYVISDLMVATIDVHFQVIDPATTKATVTYARTAITPEGDEHVKAMTEGDQTAGKEWQAAIDTYLAPRKLDK